MKKLALVSLLLAASTAFAQGTPASAGQTTTPKAEASANASVEAKKEKRAAKKAAKKAAKAEKAASS